MCQFDQVDYAVVCRLAWQYNQFQVPSPLLREGWRQARVRGGPYDGTLFPYEPGIDFVAAPVVADGSLHAMYGVIRHPDLSCSLAFSRIVSTAELEAALAE